MHKEETINWNEASLERKMNYAHQNYMKDGMKIVSTYTSSVVTLKDPQRVFTLKGSIYVEHYGGSPNLIDTEIFTPNTNKWAEIIVEDKPLKLIEVPKEHQEEFKRRNPDMKFSESTQGIKENDLFTEQDMIDYSNWYIKNACQFADDELANNEGEYLKQWRRLVREKKQKQSDSEKIRQVFSESYFKIKTDETKQTLFRQGQKLINHGRETKRVYVAMNERSLILGCFDDEEKAKNFCNASPNVTYQRLEVK